MIHASIHHYAFISSLLLVTNIYFDLLCIIHQNIETKPFHFHYLIILERLIKLERKKREREIATRMSGTKLFDKLLGKHIIIRTIV